LDELIHAIATAKDQMINIEHLSDADLDLIAEKYKLIQSEAADLPQQDRDVRETAAPSSS
jgi:low affinity Fe/Cu permease